jgi:hypothetical protein
VPPLSGPFLAISVLLSIAGVTKIFRPAMTAGALRAAGIRANELAVRLLGVAEMVAGTWAVIAGDLLGAGAVGLFYLGFSLFVAKALRSGSPISSCGCFGSEDTPPTAGHLALDLTAAILAFWMALDPPGRWLGAPGEPLSTLVPFLLFSTATVYLLYAVVDVLPRRRPAAPVPLISLSPTRGAQ